MDNIISAAIEEVCVRGASGIRLRELWPSLQTVVFSSGFELSESVKKVIWCRLASHPGLQFVTSCSSEEQKDILQRPVEELEKIGLNIVAEEHLMDSFMGLYDLKQAPHFEISQIQRRVLERLAMARSSGITQNELAKEFDIKGTNFFYVVRNLECQRLIVRQTTMVREKESVSVKNGPKGDHIVNTNLLRLSRFAKDANLNPQQRIEITRSIWPEILDEFGDTVPCISPFEGSEDCLKEDVHINDYIPAMKAICEKLEASKNKVDFVSGIKSALGYRKSTGHRAWRSILYRLKYSGLVEEFQAEVKGKDVACLRLLKKFDTSYFQPKVFMHRYNGTNSENLVKGIKRGQITDQLVEIPLEHQIYDMIDAAGKKGITILELSTRLGINLKKLHKRVFPMRDKYGVVSESEIHNKTQVYRFWTNSMYCNGLNKKNSNNPNLLPDGNGLSSQLGALVPYECPVDSISKGEFMVLEQAYSGQALETHNSCCGPPSEVFEGEQVLNDRAHKSNIIRDCDINFGVTNSASKLQDTLSSSHSSVSVSSIPVLPTKKYACRSSTVFAAQREQRILEKLENEKFFLKVELHKWLEDIEKDKPTKMDRKTLDRTLKRLQDVGSCVCIGVHMPSLSNFNSLRYAEAILHPSVIPSEELVQHIYERQRTFDIQSRRSSGSARLKLEQPVVELPVLNNVKRIPTHVDDMPALKALIANGFVLAKMVRTKLLHKFLWSYLYSSHLQNSLNSFKNPGYNAEGSGQLFSIDAAIKEMPLELFLQVAGSRLIINNLEKSCKLGLRLSDFPIQEHKSLLDSQATSRLSSIIEILHRLRLIRLVNNGAVQDVNLLSYALELHPYLEEPFPAVLPSSIINRTDNCYKLRHDFILSDKEAVDKYWETLEYCFAAADPVYSRQCFPGSTVEEVFLSRSWASVRVMTIEQRMKLLKRITSSNQTKKVSFSECVKISRELNLTLEQVLRVSYDKQQARLTEDSYLKSKRWGQSENTKIVGAVSTKRRRLSTDASNNFPQTLPEAGELSGVTERTSSDIDEQALHLNSCSPSEGENAGLLQLCRTGEQCDAVVHSQPHEEGAETAAFISQCAFDELKPTCKRRFSWTDSSDRQLVMQYARYRAMLGARFFRVEWPLLHHLPTKHDACKKRMHALNRNLNIRRAILRLCGLLGERYSHYLENSRIKDNQEAVDVDFEQSNKDIILPKTVQNQSTSLLNICKSNSQQYCWDDFEDSDIKLALDEVLKCKKLPKTMVGCKLKQGRTNNSSTGNLICSSHESEQCGASSCARDVVQNFDKKGPDSTAITCADVQNRSNNNSSCGKFLNVRGKIKISEICESLPIANAIELLKLVFLSCSKTPGVQNSLAKTLQKYQHGDIFSAFSYLSENNYLVSGHGTRPFVLSRKFFHNICSSPFPNNSGKRATIFSVWLQKQQNDLKHDGVAIAPDLQCGDIFHLSSLVFSGEISVSPSLPSTGIDGADVFKSSGFFSLLRDIDDIDISKNSKRKIDEPFSIEKAKKPKLQSKTDGDRKEKGFPDIKVFLKMEPVSGTDVFDHLGYGKIHIVNLEEDTTSVKDAHCLASSSDNVVVHLDGNPPSSWDAMPRYFEMLASASSIKNEEKPSPTDFKSVHLIINQAGEQGLNMDKISEALKTKGEGVADLLVETLEAFRLTVKVNAFDSIRVVDSSFISKYFISVLENDKIQNQSYDALSCTSPQGLSAVASKGISSLQLDNMNDSQIDARVGLYSGNKTSGIDMFGMTNKTHEFYAKDQDFGESTIITKEFKNEKSFHEQNNEITSVRYHVTGTSSVFQPILPWINGDGSTNVNVYRGLSRRILGIIMQNPYILEEDIIAKMDVLNPQSCRKLLETMLHDNHVRVRWVHQTSSSASPPSLLQNLLPSNLRRPAIKLQKHYFANPMSTRML